MIYTNRKQRPKKFEYTSQDLADLINNVITAGRIRQLARGFRTGDPRLGWLEFRAYCPDNGALAFPFPRKHKFTQDDVARVEEFIMNAREHDLNYTIKIDRWYCPKDIVQIIRRCKRLNRMFVNGELPRITEMISDLQGAAA